MLDVYWGINLWFPISVANTIVFIVACYALGHWAKDKTWPIYISALLATLCVFVGVGLSIPA